MKMLLIKNFKNFIKIIKILNYKFKNLVIIKIKMMKIKFQMKFLNKHQLQIKIKEQIYFKEFKMLVKYIKIYKIIKIKRIFNN